MRILTACSLPLLLIAAACTTQPAAVQPASTSPAESAVEAADPPQCPKWTYPELTGKTNNWEKDGCEKCADTEPGQSPIVLDPSTANRESGWKLPSPPYPPQYSRPLVLKTKGNNYKFPVNPGGGDPPLRILWEGASKIAWTLDEFHFHVPAEHAVVKQPVSVLEMHVQASGTRNGRPVSAVFAVQFAAVTNTPISLAAVASAMNGGKDIPFDLTPFLEPFHRQPTFIYTGSLTTPACDKGVLFYVLKDPIAVDAASWISITHSLLRLNGVSNARPLQVRELTRPSSVALVGP